MKLRYLLPLLCLWACAPTLKLMAIDHPTLKLVAVERSDAILVQRYDLNNPTADIVLIHWSCESDVFHREVDGMQVHDNFWVMWPHRTVTVKVLRDVERMDMMTSVLPACAINWWKS